MPIEQQIEELRAELSTCFDRREVHQIAAELRAAIGERERCAAALESACE